MRQPDVKCFAISRASYNPTRQLRFLPELKYSVAAEKFRSLTTSVQPSAAILRQKWLIAGF